MAGAWQGATCHLALPLADPLRRPPAPAPCPPQADTDAALAKMKLNWRTALVLAELELEIEALAQGRQHRQQLKVRDWVGWVGGWLGAGALLSMLARLLASPA